MGEAALRRVCGEICLCGGSRGMAGEVQDLCEWAKPRHGEFVGRFVGGSEAEPVGTFLSLCAR